jgi:DNA-directed RNA polymerase subunit beta'
MEVMALVEAGEIIEPLGDRILGRVALDDVYDPHTGDLLLPAGTEFDEDTVNIVEDAGINRVMIRSVLSCQTKRGVCVKCYGRDLARGRTVNIGEAVGVIAAQSIGEPGTQLTMRTFHIGGAAARLAEASTVESRGPGVVVYENVETVSRPASEDEPKGATVVMNRQSALIIKDEIGRERERYQIVYGASLLVADGGEVQPGTKLAEWDPFSIPILTEVGGIV